MKPATPATNQGATIELRRFSNARLPGLRIGTNYIVPAARRRDDNDARAMRWLANYAALLGLDAEDFADSFEFGPDKDPIVCLRECLINPRADQGMVRVFTAHVKMLRDAFEQRLGARDAAAAAAFPNPFRPGSAFGDGYGPLANIAPLRAVRRACNAARERGVMAEVIGLTRIGKTSPAAQWFLKNMDDAIWLHCPSDTPERDFILAFARAVGVAARDNTIGNPAIRAKIAQCFDRGGYRVVIVDEAHNVWHRSNKGFPSRLEFLRDLRDRCGTGVVLLATPQFTDHLAEAFAGDAKWAPGQYDGRVQPFRLADTLSDADLESVARHHAPEFEPALVAELVRFAKASQGYLGAMVNVIQRARDAFEASPREDRMKALVSAEQRQEQGRRAALLREGKIVRMPARLARRAA